MTNLSRPTKEKIIALFSGLWIYLILVFLGPFDAHDVSITNRLSMMSGYGIIFSLTYLLASWLVAYLENLVRLKSVLLEGALVTLIFVLSLSPIFFYYKSDFIQGESDLISFFLTMYMPLSFLVLVVLVVIRSVWLKEKEESQNVVINGTGKYEALSLSIKDLIYVKSANNYVEVHYLERGEKRKKLLRQKLKCVKEDIPELLQTHRSYLINPKHFLGWGNANMLQLTSAEVPISDRFKSSIAQF